MGVLLPRFAGLVLIVLGASPSLGRDYYVSPSGADGNPGTPALPWRTIKHAHDTAAPGDTVYFRAGTYRLFDRNGRPSDDKYFAFERGGAPDAPVTYKAYGDEKVTWDATYLFAWTQDDQYNWHVSLAGTPPIWEAPWYVSAHIRNGFKPVVMYKTATCVAADPPASPPSGLTGAHGDATGCTGRYLLYDSHNGKPYYIKTVNPTTYADFVLFWDGQYWRISRSMTDDNYWYLNEPNAKSPVGAYVPQPVRWKDGRAIVGSCAGSPAISRVDSDILPADFVHPPSTPGRPGAKFDFFLNDNGVKKLVFDLTYYDILDKTLYFRSNEVRPIADPNTQVYVYGRDMEIGVCQSNLVFEGITLGVGSTLVASRRYGVSGLVVRNCRFEGGGILGTMRDSLIEHNYFDRVGGHVWYYNDSKSYRIDWHYHDIYLDGNNDVLRNNFLGRSHSGLAAALGPCDNLQFYDNVCYGPQTMLINPGADGKIFNNVLIAGPSWHQGVVSYSLAPAGWRLFQGTTNQKFYHNYVETTGEAGIRGGNYGAPERNVDIRNNVVFQADTGASRFVDFEKCVTFAGIEDNLWLGEGNHGARLNTQVFSNPSGFVTYLASRGWVGNRAAASTARLDTRLTDAYLDTNPDIDDVLSYFRAQATAYTPAGSNLRLVYEGHPQMVTANTQLYFCGATGNVVIAGKTVRLSASGGKLLWDDTPLSEGQVASLTAGEVRYNVKYARKEYFVIDVTFPRGESK